MLVVRATLKDRHCRVQNLLFSSSRPLMPPSQHRFRSPKGLHPHQKMSFNLQAAPVLASGEEWQEVTGGGWPFQAVADHLVVDCLNPAWETRHGAALALREILSCQAASAAVVAPVDDSPSGALLRVLQNQCAYLCVEASLNDRIKAELAPAQPASTCGLGISSG